MSSPPTDDELDRLEAFLIRLDERGFMLSDADGYLAAVALSPDPIPAAEWQADLFEAHDSTPSPAETAEMADIAVRRMREILTTLDADPPSFSPIVEVDDDEFPVPEIWAEGFLVGMGRRMAAWQTILEHPSGQLGLMPILMLGDSRAMEAAFPKRGKRERERDRIAGNLPALVAVVRRLTVAFAAGGYDAIPGFATLAAGLGDPSTTPRTVEHIGRNDPCSCGSGRKYKKCCGATA